MALRPSQLLPLTGLLRKYQEQNPKFGPFLKILKSLSCGTRPQTLKETAVWTVGTAVMLSSKIFLFHLVNINQHSYHSAPRLTISPPPPTSVLTVTVCQANGTNVARDGAGLALLMINRFFWSLLLPKSSDWLFMIV